MTRIALIVNGKQVEADVTPRTHLADFLREHLLLTGTHIGCEHGICGACTVEINGEIARSCITYAVTCDGADVRTIEGFDDDPVMERLRTAFTEAHALQCGYCTPGMLVAARDLVRRKRGLSRADIRVEMSGNLCRCTGYVGIVSAIQRVMDSPFGTEPGAEAVHASTQRWLGPAPGPVRGVGTGPPRDAVADTARRTTAEVPRHAASRPAAARASVKVTVGDLEEVGEGTRLTQSFVLDHPRAAVWRLMSDIEAVALCMPGAAVDTSSPDGRVAGRLDVRLGPIKASFAGDATVERIDSEYRQIISGMGGDRKSGSRVSGRVDYRLTALADEGSASTRVDSTISYQLTGLLAQIGRSGLVRDLARRIGEEFAQNIDARLRNPDAALVPGAPLRGMSVVLDVLVARVRAFVGRLLRR